MDPVFLHGPDPAEINRRLFMDFKGFCNVRPYKAQLWERSKNEDSGVNS